ncbi:HEAT repeat domain-containing protein [Calothrix sp. PCC 6303]|uniref:HEAT repeat domain-containing protein n=1 Tax=Calothrix sp. PCC 6303 TaxID=1170562 RepID=UPI0002A0089D|nr:HEAT repeat domain-containing protein [Calothrix sp. PCC 6303]AFZ02332.1 heat domain-containing protein [Calothrix sp. PCC 6303]
MELAQIQTDLNNPDFQFRLKAIASLKDYDSEIAIPLLKTKLHDSEFLVRSFVAMALGKQQTADSFAALMQMIKFDDTPNVRAEAANSLSLFGRVAVSHLVTTFFQDDHWLVRRSILGALVDLETTSELLDICIEAIKGEDSTVQESAVDAMGTLANTDVHDASISQLLNLVNHESWRVRQRVAYSLKRFENPQAKEALQLLRKDSDHRVVGAALEELLP